MAVECVGAVPMGAETAPVVGEAPAAGVGPEDDGSTERAAEEAVAAVDRRRRRKGGACRPVEQGHRKRLGEVPVGAGDAS